VAKRQHIIATERNDPVEFSFLSLPLDCLRLVLQLISTKLAWTEPYLCLSCPLHLLCRIHRMDELMRSVPNPYLPPCFPPNLAYLQRVYMVCKGLQQITFTELASFYCYANSRPHHLPYENLSVPLRTLLTYFLLLQIL